MPLTTPDQLAAVIKARVREQAAKTTTGCVVIRPLRLADGSYLSAQWSPYHACSLDPFDEVGQKWLEQPIVDVETDAEIDHYEPFTPIPLTALAQYINDCGGLHDRQ